MIDSFRYEGFDLDERTRTLVSRYGCGEVSFVETVAVEVGDDAATGGVDGDRLEQAARLVHLLGGVSYFKAFAPSVVDLGSLALTDDEAALLRAFYVEGLGEYAVGNGLDLTGLRFEHDRREPFPAGSTRPAPIRPLVPFGGGIDSIVTTEAIRSVAADTALFVLSSSATRYAAIEDAAAVTGLPIVRVERRLDDKILRSAELGYRNGHVPVTGMLSSIAVLAAVLAGRDAVVMSNEWSSSSPTVVIDGRPINHQWSKSMEFETRFRAVLAGSLVDAPDYFSWLRARSELWVARRFAALRDFHPVFRSCNLAFRVDPAQRHATWCGRCDKCCFIDLILSPYLGAAELSAVFGGNEPLDDPALLDRFRALVGVVDLDKPFECVGDIEESRVAVRLAAARDDRAGSPVLEALVADIPTDVPLGAAAALLLEPLSADHVPAPYRAPSDALG